MKTREERREYHREYYKKRLKEIYDYLGGKCVKCGATENLEFDHIEPEKKSFNISQRWSAKQIKDELDKCQLLCYLCHKEKTIKENEGFTHGTIYAWMKKKCECDTCLESKKIWNDARNVKRRKKK